MSNTAQLSAKERIFSLLDKNSFVEVGALITKRSTDFNLQQKEVPSDGVITGYGIINDRPVYVYSQDMKALNGSIGEMHANKIAAIYDLALKVGAPVIGLVDCAGLRLEEATDALAGLGKVYQKMAMASGVVPQITAIFGTCGGGSSVMASLSDFVFMEETSAKLFVNAPNAIAGNNSAKCDTASAAFMKETGMVDFVAKEDDLIQQVRQLISVLPSNNEDDSQEKECSDDLNRQLPDLSAKLEDVKLALEEIADDNLFIEVKSTYAKEMVTGFIQLNGMTVGVVANRTKETLSDSKTVVKYEDVLTTNGCQKAEKFVTFCDAFEIPVLTLTNVSGYSATMQEVKTISTAAAKLTYAFANATVPKVNVITKKAFGSAYVTMNSKHIGADMVFALPEVSVGTMDAHLAAQIIYADDKDIQEEKAKEYDALQQSAVSAAKRGYVDAIVDPAELRQQLIYVYEMLYTKKESRPSKKHGTV